MKPKRYICPVKHVEVTLDEIRNGEQVKEKGHIRCPKCGNPHTLKELMKGEES